MALALERTAFAVAALPCAGAFFWQADGKGWCWMILDSSISAFVVGVLLWWAYMTRRVDPSPSRGAAFGAVVGILSHVLAWYIAMLGSWLTGERSSLGDRTVGPLEALPAAFIMSFPSLVVAGWLPASVGALVGWILTVRASRKGARCVLTLIAEESQQP